LHELTLSDQDQVTLHLKARSSDLKSGCLADPPFLGTWRGAKTFFYRGLNTLLAALMVLCCSF